VHGGHRTHSPPAPSLPAQHVGLSAEQVPSSTEQVLSSTAASTTAINYNESVTSARDSVLATKSEHSCQAVRAASVKTVTARIPERSTALKQYHMVADDGYDSGVKQFYTIGTALKECYMMTDDGTAAEADSIEDCYEMPTLAEQTYSQSDVSSVDDDDDDDDYVDDDVIVISSSSAEDDDD